MPKNNSTTGQTDEQIEQIMFEAMRMNGMLPPTVDEVAALDAELSSIELPFGPSDPMELLKRLDAVKNDESISASVIQPSGMQAARNLAHAAREGGELTTEIEQRMEADKARFLQNEKNNGQ